MREMKEDSGGTSGATVLTADLPARMDANGSREPTVPHAASAAHQGHAATALRMLRRPGRIWPRGSRLLGAAFVAAIGYIDPGN
jgi:hypothetical protein